MAEWYYAQDEEQFGPVTAAALKEMAQAGTLDRDDLIWREGMQRSAPARKVRGLFVESDDSSRAGGRNGEEGPGTDVLPVDDDDSGAADSREENASGDDSASGEKETAIDVLPLAGPEESKLHMPVLTAPDQSPSSARSESNEIVVFEPASVTPPPPLVKSRPGEPPAPREQDSQAVKQTRIDAPERTRGDWLVGLGLFLQTFTNATCLLVIVVGLVVYVGALILNSDPLARLSASGIYAAFVIAAYCLARTTERICRASGIWLGVQSDRTSRRTVRQRNWQRFQ